MGSWVDSTHQASVYVYVVIITIIETFIYYIDIRGLNYVTSDYYIEILIWDFFFFDKNKKLMPAKVDHSTKVVIPDLIK